MRLTLGAILLFILGSAQAALVDRGGGFIYDDVLDITWTQNANILNGFVTWPVATEWAENLSIYDSVRDVTWDDWRLASMDVDENTLVVDCSSATELACRDNELGYLYYQNGITSGSPGFFTNLGSDTYWSNTSALDVAGPNNAYVFGFPSGFNSASNYSHENSAWAVRDGDVAASVVPIPAAVWLFGSGLGLLGWMRRKQTG
jgi:hypothetical protein